MVALRSSLAFMFWLCLLARDLQTNPGSYSTTFLIDVYSRTSWTLSRARQPRQQVLQKQIWHPDCTLSINEMHPRVLFWNRLTFAMQAKNAFCITHKKKCSRVITPKEDETKCGVDGTPCILFSQNLGRCLILACFFWVPTNLCRGSTFISFGLEFVQKGWESKKAWKRKTSRSVLFTMFGWKTSLTRSSSDKFQYLLICFVEF